MSYFKRLRNAEIASFVFVWGLRHVRVIPTYRESTDSLISYIIMLFRNDIITHNSDVCISQYATTVINFTDLLYQKVSTFLDCEPIAHYTWEIINHLTTWEQCLAHLPNLASPIKNMKHNSSLMKVKHISLKKATTTPVA